MVTWSLPMTSDAVMFQVPFLAALNGQRFPLVWIWVRLDAGRRGLAKFMAELG